MNYDFIKNKFIEKHKIIDNLLYLDKYISLLINYNCENDEYKENHHILPKSTFPEFSNESWNIIKITYDDHKLAHLWLFKSINIRSYQRPLNWMMNYYKNSEEISNAAKRGWVKLKNNQEVYKIWKNNKSNIMKKLRRDVSFNENRKKALINKEYITKQLVNRKKRIGSHDIYSSEEQRRRISKFWNNITDEQYLEFSKKMKSYWTDEKKKEKSDQMKEYYLDKQNIEEKKRIAKERWDNLSEEEYLIFKQKMDIINKNVEKRKDAGEKIKKLWQSEEYLEKMKKRPKNPGTKIKLISPNGEEIIFENMKTLTKNLNISANLIRKYRDTNIPINERSLKAKNINLLNYKIETVK
jgi:competence protein ComGC